SQADQIRRWEEAAASLTHHGLQGLQEEETTEEDEKKKKKKASPTSRGKSLSDSTISSSDRPFAPMPPSWDSG
ncbi:Dynein_ axonemal_ assembly factor 2, partial [Caligus rogercresseyi]